MILNKLPAASVVAAILLMAISQISYAQMGSPEERAAARAALAEKSANTEWSTAPLIDPNTATEAELSAIEGLSDAGVQAIIAKRPFATPTEMHDAISAGMSDADLLSVYTATFVKVNLNRGESEDFKLVPSSMSPDQIAREFNEYRPFEKVEDFRREIGKYVSEKEVAFLERYVIID